MEQYEQLKDLLLDSFSRFIHAVGAYIPNLLTAVTLLLIGVLLAWTAKWLIFRLDEGISRILQKIGFATLRVRLKRTPGYYIGWGIYWLVILFFITLALQSLGLPNLAEMLHNLIGQIPNLMIAALFVLGGFLLGNAVRDKIKDGARSANLERTDMLGSWARMVIIVLAIIAALAQIGLDVKLFEDILTILIAALALAIALAFGLGAGPTVANIISARYVRKNYQIGQVIRINDLQGKILEMLPTGVVLETETGRTFIPAKVFDEEASVLLDEDSPDD
jgi:small-conductance mechanosensitive channel